MELFDQQSDLLRTLHRFTFVLFCARTSGRSNLDSPPLRCCECFLGSDGDFAGLLFGKGSLEVEHEAIFGRLVNSHEVHVRFEQAGDEVNVSGETVELCDNKRGSLPPAKFQRALQLGPVGRLLARLRLGELGDHRTAVQPNVRLDGLLLCVEAEAAFALADCGDSVVADPKGVGRVYHECVCFPGEYSQVAGTHLQVSRSAFRLQDKYPFVL